MWEKRALALLLSLFLLLGATYALVTPIFEASDELWHYPMIRHLANGNPLPVQVFDPQEAGPWKQEASQPPLYYYVGAALTFWIDTGDVDRARWLNPHVDNGVITPDGNINLVVHDPALSPWQGTLLAVRLVRLASVLMGAATVYLTYRIAREVAPQRPEVALGAAAANAFLPMFLFISGAVNNDNLAIPLSSLGLLLMIRIVKAQRQDAGGSRPLLRSWLILGVVLGLALLTKEGTLGLLPLAWGTALVVAWRRAHLADLGVRNQAFGGVSKIVGHSLKSFALILVPVLLIAGWWYARNVVLYGDWLGWNAFIAVLGQRSQPATLAQLWGERTGFLAAYWGLFGGVNVPMSNWIYQVLNVLLVASLVGFPIYFLRQAASWAQQRRQRLRPTVDSVVDTIFGFVEAHFAMVLCLLFAAAVIVGLVRWTTTTWSSQGRLVFTAISALSTLMIVGLVGWLPRRYAAAAVATFVVFLFLVAAAAPFVWIGPAYQVQPVQPPEDLQAVGATFGGKLNLVGYDIAGQGETGVQPGDAVRVTLVWEVVEEMQRDWSIFVHLNDPVLQTPLAQRDMYPGQGLLATRLLEKGQRLVETYHLSVPSTAVTPSSLELVVGLYDYYSPEYERLPLSNGRDAIVLETLALEPVAGEYPNATAENYGNELQLVGFKIEPRRVASGEQLALVVYWRALRPLQRDYTLFAQVLGDQDTTRWASQDIGQPTSSWRVGDVHAISMPLQLREDAAPGVYSVIVGAYVQREDGSFNRLQIVRDGRITMDDHLLLTRIRVE